MVLDLLALSLGKKLTSSVLFIFFASLPLLSSSKVFNPSQKGDLNFRPFVINFPSTST
jgi:hypothetical protein